MGRFVFCADLHLGNHQRFGGPLVAGINDRARMVLEVLHCVVQEVAGQRVILGDVFDVDRPNPQLIAEAQRALQGSVFLVGNHDATSAAEGHHALVPFVDHVGMVVDRPRVVQLQGVELGLVPFMRDGQEVLKTIREDLRWTRVDCPRLLGLHVGIRDERTPIYLRDSPGAIDVEELFQVMHVMGIDAVCSGDWHERRTWRDGEKTIIQCGSLCPTGFDDTSPEHGVTIWEDGKLSFIPIPGPRFVTVRSAEELEEAKASLGEGCRLFVSWKASGRATAEARTALAGSPEAVWEVVPDEREVRRRADLAATAASNETTLSRALTAFVREMPIDGRILEKDDRAEVLAKCRRHLGLT